MRVVAPSTAAAFAYEAAGGIAGSIAGVGLARALLYEDCGGDEVTCSLNRAGLTLLLSSLLSAAGSYGAGRAFDTDPSLPGAAIGSVAGAVAGVGAWHLLSEELNVNNSTLALVIGYALAQGTVTALGSRVVRALERP